MFSDVDSLVQFHVGYERPSMMDMFRLCKFVLAAGAFLELEYCARCCCCSAVRFSRFGACFVVASVGFCIWWWRGIKECVDVILVTGCCPCRVSW